MREASHNEMNRKEEIAASYDEIPYEAEIHRTVHPVRLSTAARLRGIETAPVGQSQVLEFGCALGTDLTVLAESYPTAAFMGVELSELQVTEANRRIRNLNLENVQIVQGDIEKFSESAGQFDYIICHGIYSWVPASVRDRMLRLCGQLLAPGGVANISYNTLPGWHARRDIRELVIRETASIEDRSRRAAAARDFLSNLLPTLRDSHYGAHIRDTIELALQSPNWFLSHEYLEAVNHPVYLSEFVGHVAANGMRYLDDLSVTDEPPFEGQAGEVPCDGEDVLSQQRADILGGCAFRSAVLCRADEAVTSFPPLERARTMHVSSRLRSIAENEPPYEFSTSIEGEESILQTKDPVLATALTILAEVFPSSMTIDALSAAVVGRRDEGDDPDEIVGHLAGAFVSLHTNNRWANPPLELLAEQFNFVTTISDRPVVAATTRQILNDGGPAVNRRHESASVDEVSRFVLQHLDGSNTTPDVAATVLAAFTDGPLTPPEGFLETPTSIGKRQELAESFVVNVIEAAAAIGLLTA